MRTLKTLVFFLLIGSVAYKANAFYRYLQGQQAVPPTVPTVKARAGDLLITLSGSGALQALESRVVGVREVQSRLMKIVEDGAMVRAGQVVAELDPTTVKKDLRDRQAAYDTALAAIPKTEADGLLNLNNAQTQETKARQAQRLLLTTNHATTAQAQAQVKFNGSELEQAERQKARKTKLAGDRLVPARDVELATLSAQGKRLNVTTAQKQLEVQEHTGTISASQGEMLIADAKFGEASASSKAAQQRENARFNALQTRRMLEMSQRQLEWCTIRAPISGLAVVGRDWDPSIGTDRPLRAGDQAFPSRRLMDIIDTARMIVQTDVGEIDIGHVHQGQSARVFPRAAPGTSLRARVKSVSEVAQTPPFWRSNRMPGKKVFRVVLVVLDSRPKLLRPGMTADFELVEEVASGGARVPIQAIFSRGTQKIVYLRKDGRFWPRPVKLAKRNDTEVLISQGVKPGDVLAAEGPPPSLIGPATQKARRPRPGGVMSILPWGGSR
jgi:multidrug efflux pump subunit AcrA (membrane-fusion protein)